jgi:hypothetical protein
MVELKSRSVAYLVHPVTLFAYFLLFFNDHFLKYYYPNWVSGKISDIAWVFIFPGVIAFILSLLLINIHGVNARKVWIGVITCTIIGFICVKTLIPVRDGVTQLFRLVFNINPFILVDPSDLLVLPVLFFSTQLWNLNPQKLIKFGKIRAIFISLLFFILTVASQPATRLGVSCIFQSGTSIGAYTDNGTFVSLDGGMNWSGVEKKLIIPNECPLSFDALLDMGSVFVANGVSYRSIDKRTIEISLDNKNWDRIYDYHHKPSTDAVDAINNNEWMHMSNLIGVFFDQKSGNTLFAMGTDGILLRTPGNEWEWKKVGPFSRPNPFTLLSFFQLFGLHALNLILLALIILRFWIAKGNINVTREVLGLQLFTWIGFLLLSFPATIYQLLFKPWVGILAIILFLYILGIIQRPVGYCLRLWKNHRQICKSLIIKLLVIEIIWIILTILWWVSVVTNTSLILGIGLVIPGILVFYWDKKNPPLLYINEE